METTDKKQRIKQLESLAQEVLELKQLRDQRRPLLIEFCGSPKSGKSTSITALDIFLRRNNFRTVVLTEPASVCPVDNKKHPAFNLWTLAAASSEIISHLHASKDEVDIIISDRGVFDSLCWFDWLNKNPSHTESHLDDNSFKKLTEFILMDAWIDPLDLIYVFQVDPATSILREYASLLTEKPGSIMNPKVLKGFNQSIERAVSEYGNFFRRIEHIRTDINDPATGVEYNNDPNAVSYQVTSTVLTVLKDLLVEKIGYFDTQPELESGINNINQVLNHTLLFGNRNEVELKDKIQPIAIGVITNPERNKVLIVQKRNRPAAYYDKDHKAPPSPEAGKPLLYIGGHVRKEDEKDGNDIISTLKKTLHREIQEEIGESISLREKEPFLIYSPDNKRSLIHLAVCFVIELNMDDDDFKLTSDEFISKSGPSKSGHVYEIDKLLQEFDTFEPWSVAILEHVFQRVPFRDLSLFEYELELANEGSTSLSP
jgi:ADP-ribose pyrophosphatase YjhB (NUDIX family)